MSRSVHPPTTEAKRAFAEEFMKMHRLSVEEAKAQNLRIFECSCNGKNSEYCTGMVAWTSWPDDYCDNPMTLDELGF